MAYFNQAIDIHPDYALAYAGLADCYHKLGANHILPPKEAFPRAKAMAMKALEIDDQLGEAYTTLAAMHANYDWDWKRAEKAFERAIELNPNYPEAHQEYAWLLTALWRMDEAIVEAQTALALDPFYAPRHSHLGMALYRARKYDQAIEQFRKLLARFHEEPIAAVPAFQLSLALVQKGRPEEAISAIQESISLWGDHPDFPAYLGYAYAKAGRRSQALKAIADLESSSEQYVLPFNLALVYAGLGEKDLALEWLEKGQADRIWLMVLVNAEPAFDLLRSEPRFQALLRRMNFAE